MFNVILDELYHAVRFKFQSTTEIRKVLNSAVTPLTSAEIVFQQADRLATLIMYEKKYDEVKEQAVDIILQLIWTLELLRGERT